MAKKKSPPKKSSGSGTKAKSKSKAKTYTDPDLREKLKKEITEGDKGGKSGQWSARKAQLLASEYEKAGGGYANDEKTDAQKHLDKWTDEDWKTSDGKPADREGGTTRYLPAEAWDKLSPEEKKKTNVKKQKGSKKGEQFVANTDEAKEAGKSARSSDDDSGSKKSAPKKKSSPKKKSAPKSKSSGGKKSS